PFYGLVRADKIGASHMPSATCVWFCCKIRRVAQRSTTHGTSYSPNWHGLHGPGTRRTQKFFPEHFPYCVARRKAYEYSRLLSKHAFKPLPGSTKRGIPC